MCKANSCVGHHQVEVGGNAEQFFFPLLTPTQNAPILWGSASVTCRRIYLEV